MTNFSMFINLQTGVWKKNKILGKPQMRHIYISSCYFSSHAVFRFSSLSFISSCPLLLPAPHHQPRFKILSLLLLSPRYHTLRWHVLDHQTRRTKTLCGVPLVSTLADDDTYPAAVAPRCQWLAPPSQPPSDDWNEKSPATS